MPSSGRIFPLEMLLVVSLANLALRKADSEDKCDPSAPANYATAARYANWSCFFEVWGIRKKVNARRDETSGFVFDRDLAEAICHFYNATLPIIDNEEKEKFLVTLLADDGAVALGLKHNNTKPIWENGLEVGYVNRDWRRRVTGCLYTLLIQGGSAVFWEDTPCNATRTEHVIVFCEEAYDRKIIPSRPPKPPWDLYDKCDPMNEHKFRRVRKFEDQSCYFEVDGADETVNKVTGEKEHGVSVFVFNVELARRICKNHSATLPILRSQEEESFLLDFIGQNFNYIALGLHETKTGSLWDDGTPVTYSNPDWRKSTKNGTFYTLLVSTRGQTSSYWTHVPSDELIPNGVQAICKERYGHSSMTTARTTASWRQTASAESAAVTARASEGSQRSEGTNPDVPTSTGLMTQTANALSILAAAGVYCTVFF